MRHGHSRKGNISPTYRSWQMMKCRCNNPNYNHYKNYGGRGINYPKKWEDFLGFLEDMGDRPEGLTLDRIDNNKNYSKKNCRWATWIEQANNKRPRNRSNYTSKVQGICFDKQSQKWKVVIGTPPMDVRLCGFQTEEKAITALEKYRNTGELPLKRNDIKKRGLRYIYLNRTNYRVVIRSCGKKIFDKTYKTLNEAIIMRNKKEKLK